MSAKRQFDIKPTCRRGPPQNPPNPAAPDGIDVYMADPEGRSCRVELPYPAPERLIWAVTCKRCGLTVGISAAGRADDPRSVTLPCKELLQ